jgi:predicted AAA+ superfamily ATPase
MKSRISQLIDDFHERALPEPIPRDQHISEPRNKARAIVGMRRTGKISCCYQKMSELMSNGIQKEEILYLNFEDDRLFDFKNKDFKEIVNVYYEKYPQLKKSTCHFFFDEILRIDQWEPHIQQLLDTEDVKVYITGSSTKLSKSHHHDNLVDGYKPVEIFPFSFEEFLKYHKYLSGAPKTFDVETIAILQKAIEDYLEIGGFPEVQCLDQHSRVEILQGYIDAVLLKDIVERHKVSNIKALKFLVREIMNTTGKKFSVNKFYYKMKEMSVKCTKNSLYEYIDHLTDAFMFFKVPFHSKSEKARRTNPPKIYAIDTGLLNAMTIPNPADNTPMLETLVYMHLRRKNHNIYYVKANNNPKTTFLAVSGTEKKLIQPCWELNNINTLKKELKALQSTMQEHNIPKGAIVTLNDEIDLFEEIKITPIWKWLLNQTDNT